MNARLGTNLRSSQWKGGLVVGLLHVGLIYALLSGLRTETGPTVVSVSAATVLPEPPVARKVELLPLPTPKLPGHIPSLTVHQEDFTIAIDTGHTASLTATSGSVTQTSEDPRSAAAPSGTAVNASAPVGNCTNAAQVGGDTPFPEKARRIGLKTGSAQVQFSVSASGDVTVDSVNASNKAFEATSIDVARHLKCAAGRYVFPLEFNMSE